MVIIALAEGVGPLAGSLLEGSEALGHTAGVILGDTEEVLGRGRCRC